MTFIVILNGAVRRSEGSGKELNISDSSLSLRMTFIVILNETVPVILNGAVRRSEGSEKEKYLHKICLTKVQKYM